MISIPIPIPPQLPEAIGYPGDARLMSLSWTSCGDTSHYDDGRSSGTGDAWGYLAFVRHAAVAPHLAGWDLGNSEMEGTHRLLLDLHARIVSAGTAAEVRTAVRDQWPDEEPSALTQEELDAILGEIRMSMASRPMPTATELVASMRRHSSLVAAMVAWLDQWQSEKS